MNTRSGISRNRPARGRHRAGTAVIEKGRRSVDEILDAATALLAEDGYAALSTRKVAARAGMRPGNLQYYFPAKRDMVRALLERYLERSLERLTDRMERGEQTPEGRLRQAIEGIHSQQLSELDCTLFREIWALASHDADVARAVSDFYRQYRAHLGETLRSVNPQLGRGDTRRLATAIVAMLEGLSVVGKSVDSRDMPGPGHLADMLLRLARGMESRRATASPRRAREGRRG
jgi:AcrR family transcriptional regulator